MDKRFNPDRANVLMTEERKKALPPEKVLKHLNLNAADIVADLGAGTGYFAIPIAKKASEVYALDIESKMLGLLEQNAAKENVENIHCMESDLDQIKLEDNSVDKVIIAFVLHEVPNLEKTLAEIKRILKPEGQLLLLEWEKIASESGPPLDHRIASDELLEIMAKSGYQAQLVLFNRFNYGLKATQNEQEKGD